MADFSVAILTASPPGQLTDAGGAFTKIDGREALLRSVELFLNRDSVKQIQVIVSPESIEESKRKYGPHLSFSGVKLVSGGSQWSEQLKAASERLSADATHVIVHDAARPVVAYTDLDALLQAAESHSAVALVAAVRSEIIELDSAGQPSRYRRPAELMQLLTPQAYQREQFEKMAASGQPLEAAELMLLKGSPLNIRLRGAGDAAMAKALMTMLPKPKIKAPSNPFEEAQW